MHPPAAARFEEHLAGALARDRQDPLRELRGHFALPRAADGTPLIYLCGHSLGLAPLEARARVAAQIEDWEGLAVLGHDGARSPWLTCAERLQPELAQLCGALPLEVVAMNSLSVNLHLLLASFYRPEGVRRAVLIEAGAFPSDRHVVASQIAWHGLDPQRELIELGPRVGEELLRIEDLEQRIGQLGGRLALVLWPGVQYLTGQCFDLARIVRAAHAAGAYAGFDLAHAIGNLPLALHADAADFAAWCSYKYLSGGPGAVGGAFVHERHVHERGRPRLAGWWGHEAATRFRMEAAFRPAAGAAGWAVSNPPVFALEPLQVSLPLINRAGMPALRAKSLALSGLLAALLRECADPWLELITPADPAQRGCQLSLRVRGGSLPGRRLFERLGTRGVIGDWREPDIIRLAPVPLYNGFEDVVRAARQVSECARELC